MLPRTLLGLATSLLLMACATAARPTTRASEEEPLPRGDDPLVEFSRHMCRGYCPSYSIAIYPDGRLRYEGHAYVKEQGYRFSHLSAEAMTALHAAFARAQ